MPPILAIFHNVHHSSTIILIAYHENGEKRKEGKYVEEEKKGDQNKTRKSIAGYRCEKKKGTNTHSNEDSSREENPEETSPEILFPGMGVCETDEELANEHGTLNEHSHLPV